MAPQLKTRHGLRFTHTIALSTLSCPGDGAIARHTNDHRQAGVLEVQKLTKLPSTTNTLPENWIDLCFAYPKPHAFFLITGIKHE